MKTRTGAALMIAAIICFCASIAAAQTKPDFSGAWKMNKEKSKFAGGGPDSLLIKIDHKEPALTENWSMSIPNGDRVFEVKHTTDGKEIEQQVMGGRMAKTTAKWEGAALVIEFKAEGGFFRRKLTLSADGKTLTKVVTHSEGGEQVEDTVVFDKQ